MPIEPSLLDVFGFPKVANAHALAPSVGILIARPLLFVLAFVVLLPGAAPNVIVELVPDPRAPRDPRETASPSTPSRWTMPSQTPPPSPWAPTAPSSSEPPSPWAPPSAPVSRVEGMP